MPQDRPTVDAEKQLQNFFGANEELIERRGSLSVLVAGEAYLIALDLVVADRLYRSSLFPSDNQRPSNLVIAVLAPAAHRPDRRAVWKSRHYDTEVTGALGAASGEISRHLGDRDGFHTQVNEQTAHHKKSLETERHGWSNLTAYPVKLSINGNVEMCLAARQGAASKMPGRLIELPQHGCAREKSEWQNVLAALREDEFFNRGFHQLH